MKRLRTILVEDEGAALRRLEKMADENEKIDIICSVKSGERAVQSINKNAPDLVLLDIELKDMNAFEVIRKLNSNFGGQFIFITAYSQYAVDAFEIMATDYLMKPYDLGRFNLAVERAFDNDSKTNIEGLITTLDKLQTAAPRFEIVEGTKVHYFSKQDVLWIEADGYYSKIHLVDGSNTILRKTLKELQDTLPSSFLRVNRSTIINVEFVEKKTVNISQRYYYLRGGLKVKHSGNY
ncbi:MAG: LytTR family DNA-binding domain-containing protein [Cyclobacteriaceae bacterium]